MHIVLKYNDNIYNINTIKEHIDVLRNNGKVIWGVIKPNIKSPSIATVRIDKIKAQIDDGVEVFAYLATGGEIKARGKILNVLSNYEANSNSNLVPQYYQKDLERCVAGILLSEISPISPSTIDKLQKYNSIGGKVALGNQTNPLYVSEITESNNLIKSSDKNHNIEAFKFNKVDMETVLRQIYRYINSKGFIFSYEDICNFYLSLRTKPFVILAGVSGTGKSKLVKLFSEAVCSNSDNGRYRIISVKPDWNDSTELFGYKNINDVFVPGTLTSIIIEASKPENIMKPYFVCLDEMNLARVEYYLSEYLSIIESRNFIENNILITDMIFPNNYLAENSVYAKLRIPENIYIIGTVNMDDTTFAFSRKVLDRANTIEFSEVRLEDLEFEEDEDPIEVGNYMFKTRFLYIKDALKIEKDYVLKINSKIIEINNILSAANCHFGYRVRDEIVFYMLENKLNNLLDEDMAFDYQILQKILPTISGSDYYIKEILIQLYNLCNFEGEISEEIDYIDQGIKSLGTATYLNSAKKILLMLRGYENGFASFW